MIGAGAALHAALDPGRQAEPVLQDDHRAVRHVPGRQVSRGHPPVQGHHPLITGIKVKSEAFLDPTGSLDFTLLVIGK